MDVSHRRDEAPALIRGDVSQVMGSLLNMNTAVTGALAIDVRYELPSHLQQATRQDLHRIAMAGFETTTLDAESPRADSACLFAVLGNALQVRHRPDLHHQIIGLNGARSRVDPTDPERRYQIAAEVNAEVSRSQRGSLPEEIRAKHNPRGRRVPVPEDELQGWGSALLERSEVKPQSVLAGRRFNIRRTSGRTGILPAVEIQAEVQGGEALDSLLSTGLGRGRNYGLGLVRLIALQN